MDRGPEFGLKLSSTGIDPQQLTLIAGLIEQNALIEIVS